MCEITLAGENAIIIYFGRDISPELIDKIAFYRAVLQTELRDIIIDCTPSYVSLLVSYRLDKVQHKDFCSRVEQVLSTTDYQASALNDTVLEIPVYYGQELGLDLASVLTKTQLSRDDFITIHSSQDYLTYAIGFSPVFAFLGTLDPRIQLPRLSTPRISIPAGSVGIADNQTAVYPIQSAGGWNIIGRTPLDFSLARPDNIDTFSVGMKVRFKPISRQRYLELGGEL